MFIARSLIDQCIALFRGTSRRITRLHRDVESLGVQIAQLAVNHIGCVAADIIPLITVQDRNISEDLEAMAVAVEVTTGRGGLSHFLVPLVSVSQNQYDILQSRHLCWLITRHWLKICRSC